MKIISLAGFVLTLLIMPVVHSEPIHPNNSSGFIAYGAVGAAYNQAKYNSEHHSTWIQLSQGIGGVRVVNQITRTPFTYGLNLSITLGYNIPFHCCWFVEPRLGISYDSANIRTLNFKGPGSEYFEGHTFPRWNVSAGFVLGRLVKENLRLYAGLMADYTIFYYNSKANFGPVGSRYIAKKENLWGISPVVGVSTKLGAHLHSFLEASYRLTLQNKDITLSTGQKLKKRYEKKPRSFILKAGIGYQF